MEELLRSLQLPPADVPVAQQLATAKQVQVTVPEQRRPAITCLLRQLSTMQTEWQPQTTVVGHLQVLAEDVLPALKHAPASHGGSAPALDLTCLPLGFTTGGGDLTYQLCLCSSWPQPLLIGLPWPSSCGRECHPAQCLQPMLLQGACCRLPVKR